jgi:hypothetical protein
VPIRLVTVVANLNAEVSAVRLKLFAAGRGEGARKEVDLGTLDGSYTLLGDKTTGAAKATRGNKL